MDIQLKKNPLGFWEIADKPTVSELQTYYANKYYQEAKGGYEHEYSEEELIYFQSKLEQRLHVINEIIPEKVVAKRRLLDVGCGEGFALRFFQRHGWAIKGLDFSSAGVESKNPSCTEFLVTGDLFSLLAEEGSSGNTYDVVWLQNVLEHVIDPVDLLQSLRELVSPEGVAVITVPNDCSIIQCAALELGHIDEAFWIAAPDHLSYFDHNSLKNIANATGWYCADINGDFPIDWYLFHSGSNYIRDKKLGKAAHIARIHIENLINEQPIEYVTGFWRSLAQLGMGRNLTAFLRSIVEP